ncbi:aminotransferase class V-fold PLP-dependent enzyme [Rhodobacteraceae bacterium CCMM004]|nr:aminotransferase class V-fold PLP-dependent enzyme [Rhodobacteraceae bacterium CCMM004]
MRRLFLLDPEVVFLNHGSFGACPAAVFETYQTWQLRLERQPVAFLDPDRGYAAWMADTRQALAADIGAAPDDVVGAVNATHALNLVARSLPLAEGDEILTTDHEYAALDKTWRFVAARSGARIVTCEVPLPLHDPAAFTDTLIGAMTDRTRVLFVSHITSPTALCFPIEAAVAEARRRGIWTVIDGAHTPGHIDLDVTAVGADFYAGNCHKWMMAPKGAAFLHARQAHQPMLQPLVISHGWDPDRAAPGPFGGTAFVDAMEMQGTRDPSAWLSVPAALEFRRAHDWPALSATCAAQARAASERVARMTGLPPLAAPALTAPQMVALPVPRCDPHWLKRALLERYRIEVPVFDWKENTIVRLSVQCYNSDEDIDLLCGALSDLLSLPAAA